MRYAIPVVVLVAMLVLLGIGLKLDPREVPSPLIGKPAPAFELPLLGADPEAPKLSVASLTGRPVLVNFFASWCAGCRVEHPLLMELSKQGVEIVGIDYKDAPEDARAWLARHGNPYRQVALDRVGQAGLDWGVYGVPETYVLGADGRVLFKQIGPVTPQAWERDIRPLLAGAAR
ncbi:MAG: DsbE family thiol:disulfide interchange protein [Panacagrimonas sp.]|jgi:cytochrome c biogenesis protein CcmG/thiol:disulfide interchange protein DsbE|nr:DsbE family thiol:disulfide interchange protein [Panacagrimonas sp.]MCC2655115.1 DsbE family thiol:disulfide interchange protein [Panacagrimonas sp.]